MSLERRASANLIDSEYIPEGPYVMHSGSGRIAIDDVLQAIAQWFQHPSFSPSTAVVWDLRSAYLDLTLEELSDVYDRVRHVVDGKRGGGRTAWVHRSRLVGSFIVLVGEAFDWGSQWGHFESVQEAVAWCLEVQPKGGESVD